MLTGKRRYDMKLFVTGVNGQLGYDVMNEIHKRGYPGVGSGRTDSYNGIQDGTPVTEMPYIPLDITDEQAVMTVLKKVKPDVVIHCAAWTAVDAAEDFENKDAVYAINVKGTQYLAYACKTLGCKMIYISTDYVFGGKGDISWKADETDFAPLNEYGRSKLAGELAVVNTLDAYFIVRISWVFGKNGNNFIKTMLNVGKKYDTLRVVNDQIGRPTYTKDLARLLVDMVGTEKYGCYHATNEGEYISWYDFAREIFRQAGYTTKVIPVTTEEYGLSKAARPHNSCLDTRKLQANGFHPLPPWQDALHRFLTEIKD